MVFLPSLRLPAVNETGVLIANFDIGSSAIKPNLHQTLYWQAFLRQAASGRSKWRIEGFTDCQGKVARNQSLRTARAKAVFDAMPAVVKRHVTEVDPAAAGNCLTGNLSAADRTVNRSVAIILVHSTVDMAPTTIKEKLERKTPKTDGCTQEQRDRLAIAFPLARRIGQQAMAAISWMKRGTPEETLLKKFFGPRAFDRRWRIKQNYAQALGALKTNPTYKCVAQGTDPCGGTTVAYVGFHAIVFGNPTVVCSSAFDVDHIELADTILPRGIAPRRMDERHRLLLAQQRLQPADHRRGASRHRPERPRSAEQRRLLRPLRQRAVPLLASTTRSAEPPQHCSGQGAEVGR